ncbi:predicted protein [Uncinocarpus reesii 1704]|uniref:Sphingomyelinase D n=1 Tax=Uncinocarpus reesii (strain UAMH 1704) TaxID=336963 RepID=SMD_UNCRE|nr:uncharacterized protein UREG_04748 [Uncinocarpus reesii 1704]C4JUE5.1 RecName: Full=Sphingomyelinase D; Short=SMase D; Flags: Precursor [Uncinocarpus reesii 1704]EEP79906.1 predicted protein [Uncinocarpus reesii 1704]
MLLSSLISLALLSSQVVADPAWAPPDKGLKPEVARLLPPFLRYRRPIYAIAHRVVTVGGIKDAISHGANAFEVDMCADSIGEGWWANHDCTNGRKAGDSARKIFETFAAERKRGKTVTFVWLDFKNPDACVKNQGCSIEAIQQLCRDILEKQGIRVLYGFYKAEDSRAFKTIRNNLNDREAISLNGATTKVLKLFEGTAPKVSKHQRVMDYGDTYLDKGFGDCTEKDWYTCTELRQGADLRRKGKLGKVFAWTSTVNQGRLVDQLLGKAHVDGIIYGFKLTDYYDHADSRAAANDIISWVKRRRALYYMATNDNNPWIDIHKLFLYLLSWFSCILLLMMNEWTCPQDGA